MVVVVAVAGTTSFQSGGGERALLATLEVAPSPVDLRQAGSGDVSAIVRLLAADQLGATRETTDTVAGLVR
ncbi:MAG: hypothetical protein ACR2MA_09825 [Egibacteraceae bacterium]